MKKFGLLFFCTLEWRFEGNNGDKASPRQDEVGEHVKRRNERTVTSDGSKQCGLLAVVEYGFCQGQR